MSLVSLSTVGISRDIANKPASNVRTGVDTTTAVGSFGQLLVAQIPGEALLAYTTLLAVFAAGGSDYKIGRWVLYGAIVAICPIVVISMYLARRTYGFIEAPKKPQQLKPIVITENPLDIVGEVTGELSPVVTEPVAAPVYAHLPILPAAAATAAMAIYGLSVPGSALQYELSGVGFGILAGCLAVGGGVLMSIVAPFLQKPNSATVDVSDAA
jgi:hypothetical protein